MNDAAIRQLKLSCIRRNKLFPAHRRATEADLFDVTYRLVTAMERQSPMDSDDVDMLWAAIGQIRDLPTKLLMLQICFNAEPTPVVTHAPSKPYGGYHSPRPTKLQDLTLSYPGLVGRNHRSEYLDEAQLAFRELVITNMHSSMSESYNDDTLYQINQAIYQAGFKTLIFEMHVGEAGDIRLLLDSEDEARLLRYKVDLWVKSAFKPRDATIEMERFGVVCYNIQTGAMDLDSLSEFAKLEHQIYTQNATRLGLSDPSDIVTLHRLPREASSNRRTNALYRKSDFLIEFSRPETANRAIDLGVRWQSKHHTCKAPDCLKSIAECTRNCKLCHDRDRRLSCSRCASNAHSERDCTRKTTNCLTCRTREKPNFEPRGYESHSILKAKESGQDDTLYFPVPEDVEFPYPCLKAPPKKQTLQQADAHARVQHDPTLGSNAYINSWLNQISGAAVEGQTTPSSTNAKRKAEPGASARTKKVCRR